MRPLYLLTLFVLVFAASCASLSSLNAGLFEDYQKPMHKLPKYDVASASGGSVDVKQDKLVKADNISSVQSAPYVYHGADMDVEKEAAEEIDYSKIKNICVTIPAGGKKKIGNPYLVDGVTYYPLDSAENYTEDGVASWYGPGFHGKQTANGETYDQTAMTAAHKTLPIPTLLRVENLENGREVVVRVNDRGPFSKGRIIDISESAAKRLGMVDKGTAKVRLSVLSEDPNCYAIEGKEIDLDKGKFAVQIGAFSIKENAEKMITDLNDKTVIMRTGEADNVTWHRVFKTGYNSKVEAESVVDKISPDYPGAFVIAR